MEEREISKRDDVSKLNVEEMWLRRAIEETKGIAVIQYQYVGVLNQRELWFDAYVWVHHGRPGDST